MTVGVLRETCPGENRVALIPEGVAILAKKNVNIVIETGAGVAAGHSDASYEAKGATIVASRSEAIASSDILLYIRTLGANPSEGKVDLPHFKPGQLIIGSADPLGNPSAAKELADSGVTLIALELLPRITRAQSMDILSSMATVAGYKAVLLAASNLTRMFPMFMTAAGTIKPTRVLVIGAGVAGLQAIATAKRLGAVVKGYDVRPAVKEQVESLGAKFVEMELETAEGSGGYAREMGEEFYRKQREMMTKVVAESEVVITTAAIPGAKSPVLVTEEMVKGMLPGSVIVDIAAERGGNCELTQADQTIVKHGVMILGPTNLPATVPYHASQMYSKNLTNFLGLILDKDGQLKLDTTDEIIRETLVTQGGQVVHPRLRKMLNLDTEPVATAGSAERK